MALAAKVEVLFTDYPKVLPFSGVLTLFVSVIVPDTIWERLLLVLIGLVLIGLGSILTVIVDHRRGELHLQYRSLFRTKTQTYPLSDISFVNVSEDSEGEKMYRLELILTSGQVVPLTHEYSGGKKRKERRADSIRSAL
jgi:hypothetical protein